MAGSRANANTQPYKVEATHSVAAVVVVVAVVRL